MKTKGQRKAIERRRVRSAEKGANIPRDKMVGRVTRRGWGGPKTFAALI